MSFIDEIKQRAKSQIKTIILPEAEDLRTLEATDKICKEENVNQIAFSGGSFINRILLTEVCQGFYKNDQKAYTNEKVPCGDGGIALGQMYLATYE